MGTIIPNQIQSILKLTSNGAIWIYIGVFFITSYLFVSLLTWSFIKPLKYLSIPTLITGILFLIIRLSVSTIVDVINIEEINAFKTLLPSFLKPILVNGLICLILGIIMIVAYIVINNALKKKSENLNQTSIA